MRHVKTMLLGFLLSLTIFSSAQVKPTIDRTVHFEVSENSINFGAKGGSKTLTVTASDPWKIKSNNASWCIIHKEDRQLTITAKENLEFSSKSGYFVLECESETIRIGVRQRAAELYLSLSTDSLSFNPSGGSQRISISTNGNWEIHTNGNPSWTQLTKAGDSLLVHVDVNKNTVDREIKGTIIVGNLEKDIVILQKADEISLSLSQDRLDFDTLGGIQKIVVKSNVQWYINKEMKDWVHLMKEGDTLTVSIGSNCSTSLRNDWFSINAGNLEKRIYVYQQGTPVTLSLSSQDLFFSSDPGSLSIIVSTNGEWSIGTSTYSWGHLKKNGNLLQVKVDENEGASIRTDYFTVIAGDQEKKVKITQLASPWEVSGSSRHYNDDKVVGLSYIRTNIDEKQGCRLGAITEKGEGIVVCGNNGYICTGCPNGLIESVKDINNKNYRISSISLTNSGYYCVVYGRNGWSGVVPKKMKKKLNEYNNNREEIQCISISENGDFAIVTDKHLFASRKDNESKMKKAMEKYGTIKNVCITNKGMCIVCKHGIYYSKIPSNLENEIKTLGFRPDHVFFTDNGTYLITTEAGRYDYRM